VFLGGARVAARHLILASAPTDGLLADAFIGRFVP
jgi:hypothetical protein